MSDEELIDVIESPDRYTNTIRRLTPIEIERRKIPIEKRVEIATIIFIDKIQQLLSESLYKFDDFKMPTSSILSQNQKSEIFQNEFDNYKLRRNSLNDGLDKYHYG